MAFYRQQVLSSSSISFPLSDPFSLEVLSTFFSFWSFVQDFATILKEFNALRVI